MIVALSDWRWACERVEELPARFERKLLADYTRRYQSNQVNANARLRITTDKLKRLKMPLSAISSNDTAAAWAKSQCARIFTSKKNTFEIIDEVIARYRHVAKKVKAAGFIPLGADRKKLTIEQCQLYSAKMEREAWWARQAKTQAKRAREYIAIVLGYVSKNADPYCSAEALSEWKKAQEEALDFMRSNFIGLEIETEGGHADLIALSLEQAAATSTANPELRRLEMLARIRGIKEAAGEKLWVADFITWTAPSVYHANAGDNWNGKDPKETQRYLSNQWAKARAEIKKAGLQFAGMRVAEPHADATPHWHMLVFMPKEHRAAILQIMDFYACQHLAEEIKLDKNGRKPRFYVEHIDPEKGCAVAYIAKYISKNINGAHSDATPDEETDKPADKAAADSVRTWASVWGIRQFQFFGAPPVTVWRELRRISEPVQHEATEKIRQAAGEKGKKNASFSRFIALMGGLCSLRSQQPLKVLQAKAVDSYGETKQKISGLSIMENGWEIITRKSWIKLGRAAFLFGSASDLQDGSRAARTRENNCNYTPEQINEKLLSCRAIGAAFVAFYDWAGNWITEKITNYQEIEEVLT